MIDLTIPTFTKNALALAKPGVRTIINEGGTSSGKTWSILGLLGTIAHSWHKSNPLLISIVSESLPHLKRGCIRDFQRIFAEIWDDSNWNRTDHIYEYENARIEFFGADDSTKLRGGRRDILFLNEANNTPRAARDELEVRTSMLEIIDHNPVDEYWAHELIGKPGVEYIHSTYLDIRNILPEAVIASIESRREKDPNWWRVYGLGLIGKTIGLVHPSFEQCDEMPEGGIDFYGLDFGFSNNPSCLTHNRIIGDNLYSDELIYETGLTNSAIARKMEELGIRKNYDEIFADCAEPKSIEEIGEHGFNIKSCPKGPDSVEHGIQLLNQYSQHWTKPSLNGIKEQRNYRYVQDRNGKLTNKPIDNWNHAMDSRRYGVMGKMGHDTGWGGMMAI